MYGSDVSSLLAEVAAPALVMHYRGDRVIPYQGGLVVCLDPRLRLNLRHLAQQITNFVAVEFGHLGDSVDVSDQILLRPDENLERCLASRSS